MTIHKCHGNASNALVLFESTKTSDSSVKLLLSKRYYLIHLNDNVSINLMV